ncbi:MAG TPA: sensor histidine kinase [Candidatus Bariatricus faecipullorum]|nr:sensor histidine kinase [Candidatus Bariatricus faecipullorum]
MNGRRWKKIPSLNTRMKLIVFSTLLPLTILIGYLLYVLNSSVQTFDRVSNSVNYASRYASEFKERMDYSMYYAIVWDMDLKELREGMYSVGGTALVDPYQYIGELRSACQEMAEIATVKSNQYLPELIENSLNSLEKLVEEIDTNMQERGHYDENTELLESVRNLTGLIEDNIQGYINAENANFADIKEELMDNTHYAMKVCVVAVIVVAAFTLAMSTLTVRSVVKPIQKLCEMARQVAKGNFSARTQVEASDEIAVLTNSFNDMTSEIGYLIENIKKEQENLRATESKLLQAQINPHFLYNTLDTIVWLAEEKRNEEVVSMVTFLSDFFRTTLSKGRDYITLEEEEKHVESYLKIQHFRYQDIMDYEIQIDADLYEFLIPKMTLQPLVENALYHGVKNKRGKGKITIRGYRAGESIILEVEDNGKGMTPEELHRLRQHVSGEEPGADQGFGLANVNQRIHYYFGKEYGLSFESTLDKGTKVTIALPAKNIIQK